MELSLGIRGKQHLFTDKENTDEALGSGLLPIFGTPALVSMIESAAMNSVSLCLAPNEVTVGCGIFLRRLFPTPLGIVVRAETELTEIDGNRLVFTVRAFDEAGLIAEGTHERRIVDKEAYRTEAENRRTENLLQKF